MSAQTSWKGTTSTDWSVAANWTAGVPTASIDAIIGDANFTGANQPALTGSSSCKSLTIGAGAKASTLSCGKNLSVSGNVMIGTNGAILHNGATISLIGNWTNSGTYTATKVNVTVSFSGAAQIIGGAVVTTFKKVAIGAASTTTLATNVVIDNQGNLTINGVLNPGDSPTFIVSANGSGGNAGKMTVSASGTLLVKAATFTGNYASSLNITLNAGSRVEYASPTLAQTISSSLTYSTLRISGGTAKTLAGNLPSLNSSTASAGIIDVTAGTLDLSSFTANRGTAIAGGTISVSSGATLKIGGTGIFPANFATHSLNQGSIVEYNGTTQTVSAETYGTLVLSSGSGAATKTMPPSAMTIARNLILAIGNGTSVSCAASNAVSVNGNVSIGASTTFNGSSFSHNVGGNWTNNGTFIGNSSTVTFSGANAVLMGSGANNFSNLTVSAAGVTATGTTALLVAGNLAATGSGTFTHSPGGTLTMSGTGKTISGSGITLDNLAVLGSITTANSLTLTGNLIVNSGASLLCSAGTITMSGSSKTIGNSGALSFNALTISGTLTTSSSFSIASDLSVSGSLSASAGTVTFPSSSALSGPANLFNVTLNGTRLQLASGATLGIAGVFALTAGTFDVSSTTPNTVNYNSSGPQSVLATTYDNLTVSGGSTKTAGGALTVNKNLTIGSGTVLNASTFTHSLGGNFVNGGTFTAGASTVQLTGSLDASISGATTFNSLTINKASANNLVTQNQNVSVTNLVMTTGTLDTHTNSVTVYSTRSGNGIVLGTITRTHAFLPATAYAFEGPNNTITFTTALGVNSVTITTAVGPVAGFPFSASVNRQYTINVPSGIYVATLRLHYEQGELNGNNEATMQLWNYGTSWTGAGKSASDASANYVENVGATNLSTRWTLSDSASVVRWNGSVSTAWETAANWTSVQGSPSLPPSTNDTVELGTVSFTSQPTINSAVGVKNMLFGSAQAVNLSLGSGGSLTTFGNVSGTWSNNATHSIAIGTRTLAVGGDLSLSDGADNHAIHLSADTGTIAVSGSLTESGGANITFIGAGTLSIGSDFNYSSGTFTAGNSTIIYNGAADQIVAGGIAYNNLSFEKPGGTATLSLPASITGNLTLATGGTLLLNAALTIAGNVTVTPGALLNGGGSTLAVGGDWANSGAFSPGTGTVIFNGGGMQTVSASTFNHFTINKLSGTLTLAGNVVLNGDLTLSAGTLDLATFTGNRSAVGGQLILVANTILKTGSSFPANFGTRSLAPSSTVLYTGTATQNVSPEAYGHLYFQNGGSNVKLLTGTATIAGDLVINSGATFDAGSFSLAVQGNWTNSGAFTPSTSTVVLSGSGKNVSGVTTFKNLTVSGSYTGLSAVTVNGAAIISGAYAAGSTTNIFSGDFQNAGTFTSSGLTVFSGSTAQALSLNAGFVSSGTVAFNGTVAPTFGGASAPALHNVNVNTTGGITPGTGWTINGAFTVANGATFTGSALSHVFKGSFTNNGTVTSSGGITFDPSSAVTLVLAGTSFSSLGTVTFGGSGQITLAGGAPSLTSVVIANTHSSGVRPSTSWSLSGDLTINSSALLNGGAALAHSVAGNWINNGAFNGETSTVLFNGTTEVNGVGATAFNNLSFTGNVTNAADISIAHNFTNNSSAYDPGGFTVSFTGGSSATIAGTAAPIPFDSLLIAKNAASVTLAANLTNSTALAISSGTLDLATFNVTADALAGLTISAGGTLKIGGANTLPGYGSYSFDPASTVDYAASTAQTIAPQNYGNLTSSSTGARALAPAGTIGVAGTFTPGGNTYTIAGSTVNFNGAGSQTIPAFNYNNLTSSSTGARTLASTGTIGVAGVFTPGANNFTVSGSTVNFNGGAQTIPAFTFGNLTTSGSGAKTLGGNAQVRGNLNLAAGSFADGGFTLTVNGDVTSAVTHSGVGKILLSGGSTEHGFSGIGAFNNLEINDTNGAALLSTNLVINAQLTLIDGRIRTTTNIVIIAAGGSLARTNGYIAGFLQKTLGTGAITNTFEIGDTNGYSPVTLGFANISTGGSVTAGATPGDHPSQGSSGVDTQRSVNRYWSITNRSVVFTTCSATFNYSANDLDPGANPTNFVVAKLTSGTWTSPSVTNKTSTSLQVTGLSSMGDFVIGENFRITTQPQSQIVNITSNVTFTVTVAGTPPFYYQWKFNSNNIAGSTNTALTITNVQDANAGFYSVLITNASGTALSSNALLTVNHLPVANTDTIYRYGSQGVRGLLTTLLNNDTDSDADALNVSGVSPISTNGGTVTTSGQYVYYTPPGGSTNGDSFTYAVSDGRGGIASGTVNVSVLIDNAQSQNINQVDQGTGSTRVRFDGIPGRTYAIQFTESLQTPNWQPLGTSTADGIGRLEYTDNPPLNSPPRFYRSIDIQ